MGEFHDPSRSAAAARAGNVYLQFKQQGSALREQTDHMITEAIRDAHPDCTVIPLLHNSINLSGYTAAGHATSQIISKDVDTFFERAYDAPATRLETSMGKLRNKIKFACHEMHWQNQTWTFYEASWKDPRFCTVHMYFLLQPSTSTFSPDELILAVGKWTSQLHDEIFVFDNGIWMKNSKLWTAVQSASWDDVILDPVMKHTLIKDVQNFFDSRDLYEEYAVPWKRGIILHGTPGCGKTISIKALMNSLDKRDPPVASLYVKTVEANHGTREGCIRSIFDMARSMAPCMLVLEDLDSLVTDEVRSYLFNEVDGLEDNNGILMIGSTNHLDQLDPGIAKRPSRFDRKYFYQLPGHRERVLYCEYWRAKLNKSSSIDFHPTICEIVAQMTEGFSFAYLKELFLQALLTIAGAKQSGVEDEDEDEDIASSTKILPGSAKLAQKDEKVTSTEGEEGSRTSEEWMNVVEIPSHLKKNPLMRVLKKQIAALWRDMDNTKDNEAAEKTDTGKKKALREEDLQTLISKVVRRRVG